MRTSEHETFDSIADRIGEDPARFLDKDLDDDPYLALARIRGIRSIEVIRAWLEVETSLERGPRQKVIGALNRRQSALEDDVDADAGAEEVTAA